MGYSTVLFDVDNTLLDFSAAQKQAFFMCFPDADEKTFDIYEQINTENWHRLERGEASRAQILHDRFAWFFEKIGSDANPDEANIRYLDMLSRLSITIPGAKDAVERISAFATIAVVTNGVTHVQERRLRESGLAKYFYTVVVSEQVGADKPDPRIFEEALRRCDVKDRREVLLIGDSLTADIAGAAGAGIDTCWFNPHRKELAGKITPTYITHSPEEWVKIVSGI